ncbi:hypothetical protein PV783_13240 [Chitinophaga sp. CC14]|uniref:hypothetical protein n=1 Tax=Chitinophaga sp. CC14 TaxID=3029199 RepID=UPI003B81EBD9
MKKILFITDAVSFNGPSLEFACYLCNLTHSKLTGVFLENQVLELRSAEDIREIAIGKPVPGIALEDQKNLFRDKNIDRFKNICESNGVNCLVHLDAGMPVTEVVKESRYADLIVLDAATSFSWKPESIPTAFVKEVLEKSECPVVIAPEDFDGVDEIIFTYNGSCSSVFAMKQFTNLFPQLGACKATVLSITETGKPIKGDEARLREWLDTHYNNAEIQAVEDESVSTRLLEFMFSKEKVFIVMGAYGRSVLSTAFVPNPATLVVKLVTQPVFITHY